MTDEIMITRHYVIKQVDFHLMLIHKTIEALIAATIAMLHFMISTIFNRIAFSFDRKSLISIDHFQIILSFNLVISRIMFIKTINIRNNAQTINQIRIIKIIKDKVVIINNQFKIRTMINKKTSINIQINVNYFL